MTPMTHTALLPSLTPAPVRRLTTTSFPGTATVRVTVAHPELTCAERTSYAHAAVDGARRVRRILILNAVAFVVMLCAALAVDLTHGPASSTISAPRRRPVTPVNTGWEHT